MKRIILPLLVVVACLASLARAGTPAPSRTAGFNADVPTSDPIFVPFTTAGNWQLVVNLTFEPTAPRMRKHFDTPRQVTGAPILIDALQPILFLVDEDFPLIPIPGTPGGEPVRDWHEEIQTPGWEWVTPNDPRLGAGLPNPFPPGQPLITRNGEPWPSQPIPLQPSTADKLWVEFPPIFPGEVLDIHKALLWVGTDGNRIWGDNQLDSGTLFPETFIDVIEYPTPEPGMAGVVMVSCIAALLRRRG